MKKNELRELRPKSKANKGDKKSKKVKIDLENIGKSQREKKPWKKNFKVKVSALKIKHKKDMKEMTELAKVISGAKQDPPEPVDAAASDVVHLNAIIKKHRYSK